MLLLGCLTVFLVPVETFAQEGTRSHRLLGNGMPSLSGGRSQLELLQRLNMLSGAAQSKGQELLESPSTDPATMRSLQQAMQSLQRLQGESPNTNPPSQQGDGATTSSSSNGSTVPQRPNSPSASPPQRGTSQSTNPTDGTSDLSGLDRIDEQMGLKLGDSSNGPPNGRPSGTEEPGTIAGRRIPNGQRPGQRNQGTDNQTEPLPERGLPVPQTQPGSNRPRNNGSVGSDRTRSLEPGLSPSGSPAIGNETARSPGARPGSETGSGDDEKKSEGPIRSLLNWFTGREQENANARQGTGRPGKPVAQPGRAEAGAGTTGSRPGNRNGSSNNNENPFQNSVPRTEPGSREPSSTGNSWFPGSDIAPPRDPRRNSETASGTRRQGRDGRGSDSGTPAAAGANPQPAARRADQSADDGVSEVPERETAEERREAQREERLDEVRGGSKTLRQKLVEIAKLARAESNQSEASGDSSDSTAGAGLQSAFVEALQEATKGLAEHLDELVTENQFERRERGWRQRSRREGRGGPLGRLSRLGDRANDWFVSAVEPDRPAVSEFNSDWSSSEDAGSVVSFELVLALLVICGLAYWMYQRRHTENIASDTNATRTVAPTTLTSRQDIIQAFHDLVNRGPAAVADWWTHDRAAQALATSRPSVNQDVQQLARLYEQARYLPDDSTLTDEQYAAAKAAWLRCRKP